MYVCMYVCMHVCMYVCMYVRMCVYVCMYIRMYVCLGFCLYVCMYVCLYVCNSWILFVCVCSYAAAIVFRLDKEHHSVSSTSEFMKSVLSQPLIQVKSDFDLVMVRHIFAPILVLIIQRLE